VLSDKVGTPSGGHMGKLAVTVIGILIVVLSGFAGFWLYLRWMNII
jgi:hypothetical protein